MCCVRENNNICLILYEHAIKVGLYRTDSTDNNVRWLKYNTVTVDLFI